LMLWGSRSRWLYLVLALAGVAAAQDVNAPAAFAANEGLVTDIGRHQEVSVAATREIALREAGAVPGASHELRLSLFVFHGTRWSQNEIEAAVVRSARLLAQCSVALKHAALHVLETPQRFHVYSTPVARELLRQLTVTKPAVFFVQDTQNRPAYEAEAIGRGNASSRPELADTVWIAYGARDLAPVLAHELVHILSDSGEHSVESDNLMAADTSPASTRLSPVQCDRLRSRGSANGLLGQ